MTKHLRGFISLLLVFVLCLGMIPSFFVTEASAASTQGSIMLFDFSDNGDYTSRLNSQLSVSYKPNGSGTTRTAYIKNLGWHFARYGNVPYADDPLYCIEPWRDYAASTSGNSVDRDITLNGSYSSTGSNVWYALPAARREAIGLILLYSDQMWDDSVSVFNVKRDSNPNVPLRVATQFLIYEIVCGLRNPTTFALNSTNECGTAGDIFYNAGVAAISNFAPNYNTLVSYVQSALQRPSFTGSSSSNAPTITLTGDETSVYDSNGVLSNWSFTDGKSACAVLIVSNTWNIVMGIFDATQSVVGSAAGLVAGNTSINISSVVTDLEARLEAMELGPLFGLWFQSLFVGICTWAITICIFIVIYGRMIEVYLVTSVAPIPMATMANREWSQMGQNYLRALLALGFQAFLIVVCVAIYAVLLQNIAMDADISKAIWTCMGYTVLLCFCLFKTSSLAKSVFNAH